MKLRVPAVLLTAATLAGLSLQAVADELEQGKVIFEKTAGGVGCADCHGMDARGGGLAPDIRRADIRRISDALRNVGDMRGFGLSQDDIVAVATYLSTIGKPGS